MHSWSLTWRKVSGNGGKDYKEGYEYDGDGNKVVVKKNPYVQVLESSELPILHVFNLKQPKNHLDEEGWS